MNTDELILSLARDLRPVPRAAVQLRLASGILMGAAVSTILLLLLLGPRPDLGHALDRVSFWLRWSYAVSTGAVALFAAARMARPDGTPPPFWILAIPALLLAPFSLWELTHVAPAYWAMLLLGHGWSDCSWIVLGLSLPIYAGLLWAFRRFAPANLEAAGASAGLSAGGFSAAIYCVHCPANSAVFALVWYTLGIVLAGLIGALVGRRLMRW